jgi:hypothetical protein
MSMERPFIKYLGHRKWRKPTNRNISVKKALLMYLGNRKWKENVFNTRGFY